MKWSKTRTKVVFSSDLFIIFGSYNLNLHNIHVCLVANLRGYISLSFNIIENSFLASRVLSRCS